MIRSAIILGTLVFIPNLPAQTKLSATVTDPRPLAAVADLLELKYGVMINYEDPPYLFPGDIQDVTATVAKPESRAGHPGLRIWVPRGGSISLSYLAKPPSEAAATTPLLENVVAAHEAAGNPGTFKVEAIDSVLNLVPLQVKNREGKLELAEAPLDTSITIPAQRLSAWAAVKLVCAEVSRISGKTVQPGTAPANLLFNTRTSVIAQNEPARNVLVRVLSTLSWAHGVSSGSVPKVTWRLFYGPDTGDYVLNFHIVMVEVDTPQGNKTRVPL